MQRIVQPEGQYRYTFGPAHPPVATVQTGETIKVVTEDAFGGRIKSSADRIAEKIVQPYVNPLTGPIYVAGADPGDTLVVEIHNIRPLSDQGATAMIPYFGGLTATSLTRLLHDPLPAVVRICPLREGFVQFSEDIAIPYEPFFGCIGTAPQLEVVSSLSPGTHGGNMDVPDVAPGNKVMLPVNVPGALLFLGDVHACQGDGELTGVAVEIPAESTITIDVLKRRRITSPRLESPLEIMCVGNARPMEDAVRIAYADLVEWLTEDYGFDKWEAYQLLGQVGRVRLGNMVDTLYSMVAKCPKRYLSSRPSNAARREDLSSRPSSANNKT